MDVTSIRYVVHRKYHLLKLMKYERTFVEEFDVGSEIFLGPVRGHA